MKLFIPKYLYEKYNLIRLVIFTALFALIFINIYKPFGSKNWYPGVSELKYLIYSSLIILTGVLVVVISRIIMFHYTKKRSISYLNFAIWIISEIFFMSLFYTIYTYPMNTDRDLIDIFQSSAINTSLILLIPYSVLWLYFSWKDKEKRLQMIEEGYLSSINKSNILPFYDEKGELRLSVKREALVYIESADNYVCIGYLKKGIITKFMLRNSLKAIEEQLKDTSIIRCHRSYMVNFDHVKVLRKSKDGIFLELGIDQVPDFLISRTYSEKATTCFLQYSPQ